MPTSFQELPFTTNTFSMQFLHAISGCMISVNSFASQGIMLATLVVDVIY